MLIISWLDFYLLLFWILFVGFFISFTNVLNLLILGEVFWIIMTTYLIYFGAVIDQYFLFFITMYLFVLASSETSVGLALITLRNTFNFSISTNSFNFKQFFLLRKRIIATVASVAMDKKKKKKWRRN